MTEQQPTQTVKAEVNLYKQWEQLPAKQQAIVALNLLNKILDDTYDIEMLIALKSAKSEVDGKSTGNVHILPITSLTLHQIGVQAEHIALLSADDLTQINHNIQQHLNLDVFPDEVKWQVNELLDQRNDGG